MSTWEDLDFLEFDEEDEEVNLYLMTDNEECSSDDSYDEIDFTDLDSVIKAYH